MSVNPSMDTNGAKFLQIFCVVVFLLGVSYVHSVMTMTVQDMEQECGSGYLSGFRACEDAKHPEWEYYAWLCMTPLSLIGFGLTAFGRVGFFAKAPVPTQALTAVTKPGNQTYSVAGPLVPTGPSIIAAPPAAQNAIGIEDELQKVADMLAKGLIDEEEYKQLKRKIIGKA